MASWSKLTQAELRVLLRSHGQPTGGGKAALVQRLSAFLSEADDSDDSGAEPDDGVGEGGRGPSASEAAELEAAGASTELSAWRAATSQAGAAASPCVGSRASTGTGEGGMCAAAGRSEGCGGHRLCRAASAPRAAQRADLPAPAARRA